VDREEIERQDFPAARRGYDAAAVQQHLSRVADAFEALVRRPAPGSLAEGASTRVQAIIEAAETSAQQLREDAGREATAHVERVAAAARGLLAEIERARAELDALLGTMRQNAASLGTSLDELAGEVATIRGPAAEDEPGAAADPAPAIAAADERAAERSVSDEPAAEPAPSDARAAERGLADEPAVEPALSHEPAAERGLSDEPPVEPALSHEPAAEPAPSTPTANGARSDDEAGARLVALNMALEGAPRDETLRYLADHYELPDLDALLDDVYASAGR
jgi:DivIVA domain-containing protein